MFSIAQKRQIADAVQKVLRDTKHPELPDHEICFSLHVDGAQAWSWADIRNNGAVTNPDMNPWNEQQALAQPSETRQPKPPNQRCDVTQTVRYANPNCKCPTYEGNLGPCASHEQGANGRCVYCDHELNCYPTLARPTAEAQKELGHQKWDTLPSKRQQERELEARLDEAKWWRAYHGKDYNGEGTARIAELESELAALTPQEKKPK
jgi:hypothetical protein